MWSASYYLAEETSRFILSKPTRAPRPEERIVVVGAVDCDAVACAAYVTHARDIAQRSRAPESANNPLTLRPFTGSDQRCQTRARIKG